MLEQFTDHGIWLEFFEYKRSRHLLSRREEEYIGAYINERRYEDTAREVAAGRYCFSSPQKHLVNKMGSEKKRVVYTFSEDENMLLKLLSYLLYKYDGTLSDNCYSFRKNVGAKRALFAVTHAAPLDGRWCFKADVSNYFNSIDIPTLLPILKETLSDDLPLYRFLADILQNDEAVFEGKVVHEAKGVMAGTPISPFLANIYLTEMDEYFASSGAIYARYSDDIIIFDDEEKIKKHIEAFHAFLTKYGLKVNEKKQSLTPPGEPWSFLGFKYADGVIDISDAAVEKMMGKIRRAARALRRWKVRKKAESERAVAAMNRKFNKKFYSTDSGRELSWARWYFPVLSTDAGLKKLDRYMQQYLRYIAIGSHSGKNAADFPYDALKRCGYRPLVAEFYKYRRELRGGRGDEQ